MRDDLNAQGGRDGGRRPAPKAPETERLTDREVPLEQSHISAAVHAWLDGELPESAVRGADTKRELEFWQRVNAQTAVRRELRTPPHVQAQIMAALPQTAPTMISPWWRREFVVSPAVAVATAASLVALGAAASAVVIKALK
jgi:hypothetical protein